MARILIVDDEEIIRRLVTTTLSLEGHTVEQATNGHEAAGKLSSQHFDLVITDIVMPGVDGLEMIMNVQRDNQRLPVIAITGMYAQSPLYLKIATSLGAWRTLRKPFTPSQLVTITHDVLVDSGHGS